LIIAVCHRHFAGALCTALFLSVISTAAVADPRCQQLEALNRQYMGVSLTSQQQQLKRRLVAWYNANCRTQRASR
jgi:hypothetical protein